MNNLFNEDKAADFVGKVAHAFLESTNEVPEMVRQAERAARADAYVDNVANNIIPKLTELEQIAKTRDWEAVKAKIYEIWKEVEPHKSPKASMMGSISSGVDYIEEANNPTERREREDRVIRDIRGYIRGLVYSAANYGIISNNPKTRALIREMTEKE